MAAIALAAPTPVTVVIIAAATATAAPATFTIASVATTVVGLWKLFHVQKFADIGGEKDAAVQHLAHSIGGNHDIFF